MKMRSILLRSAMSVSLLFSAAAALAKAHPSGSDRAFALGEALVLPAPDLSGIRTEDAKRIGGPYRYGVQIPVRDLAIDLRRPGGWRVDAGGMAVWQVELVSPGARTLDFHFARLTLPAGATLTLRGEGEGNFREITASSLSGDSFWSPYVVGERVRLELRVPRALRARAVLELAEVTHGYRGLFESAQPGEKSGSCNVDAACSQGNGWQDQMSSVGQYTFSSGGSSYVCTGSLVANTGNTTAAYFLTANHCLSTAAAAGSVVVYWNYQNPQCRAPGSSASGTPISKTTFSSHSQSGATLRATYAPSDMTLLELSTAVPQGASVFFSGWNRGTAAPASARGIHHPAGHEKRFSSDNNALTVSAYGGGSGTTHWRVGNWESGTTEGGSSGSGLWDPSGLLIGQLHGGSAACGNTLSDYYGRLSVSWAGGGTNASRLSNWLDPGNTGVTSKTGYRAAGFFQNATDVIINDNVTVESSLTVSGRTGSAPSALRVNVRLTHSYIGDLKIDLVGPSGAVVATLHNRTGAGADNVYRTYTVNASAQTANGSWRLRVNDNATGDSGRVDAWSLQF
jgi:lysyl endopeptidase